MNEITKFRVWDKFSQKFLLPTDFQINGNGILFIKNGFINGGQQDWTYGNKDGHIIQQFTGLKDKNDKEICEGDILKTNKFKAEVEYSSDCASFGFYLLIEQGDFYSLNEWNLDFEIIGNIFENSELLNK